jgi:hypothetical protein
VTGARATREKAGLLTGHAIGQDGQHDPTQRGNATRDAAGVFTREEDKL